jgi:CRP/FNR family cyclic AMP-dependent transcriptional regulator
VTTETLDMMAAHPFLSGLPPLWLERLALLARPVIIDAGDRIFSVNRPADTFWLVDTGRVALTLHVPGRGDEVIETIGAGQVVGWSWLFPPYRWHFGAVTTEAVLAIAVDGAGTRSLCDIEPAFGYELTRRFMAVVVERMQATRMRLLGLYDTPT